MSEEFCGDVLLADSVDGSEISIANGLILPDEGFRTAVYLSLFGGNEEDSGAVVNSETWWGNLFENISSDEKLVSKFVNFIKTNSLSSKNIQIAEVKAAEDLQWLIDDGAADAVDCSISVVERNRIDLKIVISKSGKIVEDGNFGVQWEAMKDGI